MSVSSFRNRLSPRQKVFARLNSEVHGELERLFEGLKNDGVTQKVIASRLGISEGALSNLLSGRRNLTLRSLSDIAWATGAHPAFEFEAIDSGNREVSVTSETVHVTVERASNFENSSNQPNESSVLVTKEFA